MNLFGLGRLCTFLTANSGAVLVKALFYSFSFMHSVKFLSWIRKPESLILDEKTRKFNLAYENQKVLFWIRKPESLMLYKKKERLILDKKNRTVLFWIRNQRVLNLRGKPKSLILLNPNWHDLWVIKNALLYCNLELISKRFNKLGRRPK